MVGVFSPSSKFLESIASSQESVFGEIAYKRRPLRDEKVKWFAILFAIAHQIDMTSPFHVYRIQVYMARI